MLKSVREYLFSFSDTDEEVVDNILKAMEKADRQFFTGRKHSYTDSALPIGKGQTISQPSTVARIIQISNLSSGNDVLEIGTGSGWNASVMAFINYPGKVISVESIAELANTARENINQLKNNIKEKNILNNIEILKENIFSKGLAWKRKYNAIIFTAGIAEDQKEKIKAIATDLLKKEGRLICPYRRGPLIMMEKNNEKIETTYTEEEYLFVPLT